MYGLIGDAHIGFKAYNSDRRTQETIDLLAQGLRHLQNKPIVLFAGDFFDDTSVPNWVKKQIIALKELYANQKWIILGGNHDSTKTYSSVSALDVFGEVNNVVVINNHKPEVLEVDGLKILCIPHVKSQKEFLDILDLYIVQKDYYDVILLHCMVGSNLDLGPNDLNIDLYRVEQLSKRAKKIYIGHQHQPMDILDNVLIPGSICEFDFGQLGKKFVYGPEPIELIQPRKMVRVELEFMPVTTLLDNINLTEDSIYRIDIKSIPIEEYSNIKTACDLLEKQFKGDVLFNLYKLGHKELQITAIDARFDLLDEFNNYCQQAEIEIGRKNQLLQDAVAEILAEEDDL